MSEHSPTPGSEASGAPKRNPRESRFATCHVCEREFKPEAVVNCAECQKPACGAHRNTKGVCMTCLNREGVNLLNLGGINA